MLFGQDRLYTYFSVQNTKSYAYPMNVHSMNVFRVKRTPVIFYLYSTKRRESD
jgi:hypothetical protein